MSDPLSLDGFPAATRALWEKLAEAALKGRPLAALGAKTHDGLRIDPLPARRRDARPIAGCTGPWQAIQRIEHPDPKAANAQALEDLENGASGLTFVFEGAVGAHGYGIAGGAGALEALFAGIYPEAGIAIECELARATKDVPAQIAALLKTRGVAPSAIDMRFGFDPLGLMAGGHAAPMPWRDIAPVFARLVGELAAQGFRGPFAAADARPVHDAGGSEAQELAFALANAVIYLRALDDAGVAPDAARGMIFFRVAVDADQFLTMAKLRALRLLWARVETACGLAPRPAFISAQTAWRMMSTRDVHVNMLRTTIAALAAGLGGADAVTVLPHNAALGLPDPLARRIARNAQLIEIEESHLGKVMDPAAGAGGIENLTDNLARAAWALFQEIEAQGGGAAAIESGFLQKKVHETRAARERAVATRRDPLTGTSDYPDLGEIPPTLLPVKRKPQTFAAGAMAPMRLAEPFEKLREASDRAKAKTGKRPAIFLANLGNASDFTARATFAKSLFESGGIEAKGNDGFADFAALTTAFKASGARLACLCSSDAVYAREGAAAAKALAGAGAAHIYLAGRPGENEAALRMAGVAEFVNAGTDALATLSAAHAIVGIGRE